MTQAETLNRITESIINLRVLRALCGKRCWEG
jgi:hypothetical protein